MQFNMDYGANFCQTPSTTTFPCSVVAKSAAAGNDVSQHLNFRRN